MLPCTELAHIRQGSRIRAPHQKIRLIAEYPAPQKVIMFQTCTTLKPRDRDCVQARSTTCDGESDRFGKEGVGEEGWADFLFIELHILSKSTATVHWDTP